MSDFYQTGMLATFHRLGRLDRESIEAELGFYSRYRPVSLVLPSLYSEIEGESLGLIVNELKEVKYIHEVVVTLGPASREEFENAKRFFGALPQKTTVIWNSGERIREIQGLLASRGLNLGQEGKGKSAWMAYGYVFAQGESYAIALHDCDIKTYDRMMLARLCYPILSQNMNYEFCKGYYSRVTDRMHGRVTRLLVTPLIRSLEKLVGHHPILLFMDGFRYPLAGEFAIHTDLVRSINIPGDWGLEVGVLAEIYRNCAVRRVCQVDISENYEHKHQPLSAEDPEKGLMKMCVDICKSIFRTLSAEGIIFWSGFFNSLTATYTRTAQEMLKRYEDDAAINGLIFDRHEESSAIDAFTRGMVMASETIMKDPLGAPLITSWDRVASAVPDILNMIKDAVEADNRL